MYKVIIADDEIIERKFLRKVFSNHEKEYKIVAEASSGTEVLKQVEQYHPHIVIMDINMPLGNGLDSAIHIKKKYPEIIILLNTAYAEFEFARKAIQFHMDGYLLKPTSEKEIFQTLNQCLQINKASKNVVHQENLNKENDFINEIVEYIENNYKEPINLQLLSDLVHFSPSYLSRIFHQEQGVTLRGYLNQVRIKHAIELLKETKMTVYEVAGACGFVNVSHFNRVFKQHTGKAPAEVRKGS